MPAIKDYLRFGRTPICRPCLIAGLCTALVLANLTALALGTATLRYEGVAEILFSPTSQDGVRGAIYDFAAEPVDHSAHVAALRSPQLADRVVAAFQLDTRPEYTGGTFRHWLASWRDDTEHGLPLRRTAERLQRAREGFAKDYDVSEGDRATVQVKFAADDPGLAISVVNGAAELYVKSLAAPLPADPTPDLAAIGEQIAAARSDLEKGERELAARATVEIATAQQISANDEIASLAEALAQAEGERAEADSRAASTRAAIAEGRAESVLDARSSPLARQLTQSRASIQDMLTRTSKTLPPHHPRLQELARDLSSVDHQIAAQTVQVAERQETIAEAAKAREADLRRKLKGLKGKSEHKDVVLASTQSLQTDLDARREALQGLLAQQQDLEAQAAAANVPAAPPAIVVPAQVAAPISGIGFGSGVLTLAMALGGGLAAYRIALRRRPEG